MACYLFTNLILQFLLFAVRLDSHLLCIFLKESLFEYKFNIAKLVEIFYFPCMLNKMFEKLQTVKIICETVLLCTLDERFGRPWQPLKGIAINKIYVCEFS
jgi:hypothetical protein